MGNIVFIAKVRSFFEHASFCGQLKVGGTKLIPQNLKG